MYTVYIDTLAVQKLFRESVIYTVGNICVGIACGVKRIYGSTMRRSLETSTYWKSRTPYFDSVVSSTHRFSNHTQTSTFGIVFKLDFMEHLDSRVSQN